MSANPALDAIFHSLSLATGFAAIFGKLPAGDSKTKRAAVRAQFAYLAKTAHPDHAAWEDQALAEKAFEQLRAFYTAAEDAIVAGTYDEPFPAGKPGTKIIVECFELTSKTATYRCAQAAIANGDFSIVYRAQHGTTDVIVKIASEPTSNPLLEIEAQRLKKFHIADVTKPIARFLPDLIDTFMIQGPDRRQYRANVMTGHPGMLSLTQIKAAFPGGLQVEHGAWIARRVMAQPCAANLAGLVHAAITPDHVLVDPIRHEPLHIGWLHSVTDKRLTMIVDRWKPWYPPEIFAKKVPTHQTDLYMAAMTCLWLFGGNIEHKTMPAVVPEPVATPLFQCLEKDPAKRPKDGVALLDQFTSAIRATWGREYRPLMMPM